MGPLNKRLKVKPALSPIKEPLRDDVDAVAVVVEGRLVEQGRADDVGGVNHGTVGRIAEDVADGRHVVAAPLRGPVGLGNLLGDPVPEDGELAAELVIDAGNLFAQARWRVVAAKKLGWPLLLTELLAGKMPDVNRFWAF